MHITVAESIPAEFDELANPDKICSGRCFQHGMHHATLGWLYSIMCTGSTWTAFPSCCTVTVTYVLET